MWLGVGPLGPLGPAHGPLYSDLSISSVTENTFLSRQPPIFFFNYSIIPLKIVVPIFFFNYPISRLFSFITRPDCFTVCVSVPVAPTFVVLTFY